MNDNRIHGLGEPSFINKLSELNFEKPDLYDMIAMSHKGDDYKYSIRRLITFIAEMYNEGDIYDFWAITKLYGPTLDDRNVGKYLIGYEEYNTAGGATRQDSISLSEVSESTWGVLTNTQYTTIMSGLITPEQAAVLDNLPPDFTLQTITSLGNTTNLQIAASSFNAKQESSSYPAIVVSSTNIDSYNVAGSVLMHYEPGTIKMSGTSLGTVSLILSTSGAQPSIQFTSTNLSLSLTPSRVTLPVTELGGTYSALTVGGVSLIAVNQGLFVSGITLNGTGVGMYGRASDMYFWADDLYVKERKVLTTDTTKVDTITLTMEDDSSFLIRHYGPGARITNLLEVCGYPNLDNRITVYPIVFNIQSSEINVPNMPTKAAYNDFIISIDSAGRLWRQADRSLQDLQSVLTQGNVSDKTIELHTSLYDSSLDTAFTYYMPYGIQGWLRYSIIETGDAATCVYGMGTTNAAELAMSIGLGNTGASPNVILFTKQKTEDGDTMIQIQSDEVEISAKEVVFDVSTEVEFDTPAVQFTSLPTGIGTYLAAFTQAGQLIRHPIEADSLQAVLQKGNTSDNIIVLKDTISSTSVKDITLDSDGLLVHNGGYYYRYGKQEIGGIDFMGIFMSNTSGAFEFGNNGFYIDPQRSVRGNVYIYGGYIAIGEADFIETDDTYLYLKTSTVDHLGSSMLFPTSIPSSPAVYTAGFDIIGSGSDARLRLVRYPLYSSSDSLQSVTERGNTTSNEIQVGRRLSQSEFEPEIILSPQLGVELTAYKQSGSTHTLMGRYTIHDIVGTYTSYDSVQCVSSLQIYNATTDAYTDAVVTTIESLLNPGTSTIAKNNYTISSTANLDIVLYGGLNVFSKNSQGANVISWSVPLSSTGQSIINTSLSINSYSSGGVVAIPNLRNIEDVPLTAKVVGYDSSGELVAYPFSFTPLPPIAAEPLYGVVEAGNLAFDNIISLPSASAGSPPPSTAETPISEMDFGRLYAGTAKVLGRNVNQRLTGVLLTGNNVTYASEPMDIYERGPRAAADRGIITFYNNGSTLPPISGALDSNAYRLYYGTNEIAVKDSTGGLTAVTLTSTGLTKANSIESTTTIKATTSITATTALYVGSTSLITLTPATSTIPGTVNLTGTVVATKFNLANTTAVSTPTQVTFGANTRFLGIESSTGRIYTYPTQTFADTVPPLSSVLTIGNTAQNTITLQDANTTINTKLSNVGLALQNSTLRGTMGFYTLNSSRYLTMLGQYSNTNGLPGVSVLLGDSAATHCVFLHADLSIIAGTQSTSATAYIKLLRATVSIVSDQFRIISSNINLVYIDQAEFTVYAGLLPSVTMATSDQVVIATVSGSEILLRRATLPTYATPNLQTVTSQGATTSVNTTFSGGLTSSGASVLSGAVTISSASTNSPSKLLGIDSSNKVVQLNYPSLANVTNAGSITYDIIQAAGGISIGGSSSFSGSIVITTPTNSGTASYMLGVNSSNAIQRYPVPSVSGTPTLDQVLGAGNSTTKQATFQGTGSMLNVSRLTLYDYGSTAGSAQFSVQGLSVVSNATPAYLLGTGYNGSNSVYMYAIGSLPTPTPPTTPNLTSVLGVGNSTTSSAYFTGTSSVRINNLYLQNDTTTTAGSSQMFVKGLSNQTSATPGYILGCDSSNNQVYKYALSTLPTPTPAVPSLDDVLSVNPDTQRGATFYGGAVVRIRELLLQNDTSYTEGVASFMVRGLSSVTSGTPAHILGVNTAGNTYKYTLNTINQGLDSVLSVGNVSSSDITVGNIYASSRLIYRNAAGGASIDCGTDGKITTSCGSNTTFSIGGDLNSFIRPVVSNTNATLFDILMSRPSVYAGMIRQRFEANDFTLRYRVSMGSSNSPTSIYNEWPVIEAYSDNRGVHRIITLTADQNSNAAKLVLDGTSDTDVATLSGKSVTLKSAAGNTTINSSVNTNINSTGNTNIVSTGNTNIDGSKLYISSAVEMTSSINITSTIDTQNISGGTVLMKSYNDFEIISYAEIHIGWDWAVSTTTSNILIGQRGTGTTPSIWFGTRSIPQQTFAGNTFLRGYRNAITSNGTYGMTQLMGSTVEQTRTDLGINFKRIVTNTSLLKFTKSGNNHIATTKVTDFQITDDTIISIEPAKGQLMSYLQHGYIGAYAAGENEILIVRTNEQVQGDVDIVIKLLTVEEFLDDETVNEDTVNTSDAGDLAS
jgi:hypothetical protein